MRTCENSLSSELETQLRFYLDKQILFYPIPKWLDEAFQAHGVSERILADNKKVNSILTDEDINFYNSQVDNLMSVRGVLNIPSDIYFTHLYEKSGHIGSVSTQSYAIGGVCAENSISTKEALKPFVSETDSENSNILWSHVVRFTVQRMNDSHIIGVRFEPCDTVDVRKEQAIEWEKLSEFIISEFGVSYFAKSELFKRLLST